MEKEMATHSSVFAWRIPGKGEPGGLPAMGSHRVGHDWSDLAAAAAAAWRNVLLQMQPPGTTARRSLTPSSPRLDLPQARSSESSSQSLHPCSQFCQAPDPPASWASILCAYLPGLLHCHCISSPVRSLVFCSRCWWAFQSHKLENWKGTER